MVYVDMTQSTEVTEAEHKAEFKLTNHNTFIALWGGLWGVYELWGVCGGNWPRDIGITVTNRSVDRSESSR